MTLSEFKDMANEGIVIECLTTQQRRKVLELFEENGFPVGSATRAYMRPEGDRNITYMHPAFKPDESLVCCYRKFGQAAESGVRTLTAERDWYKNAFAEQRCLAALAEKGTEGSTNASEV